MIVSSPPFQMGQKLWGLLSRGPCATCQRVLLQKFLSSSKMEC